MENAWRKEGEAGVGAEVEVVGLGGGGQGSKSPCLGTFPLGHRCGLKIRIMTETLKIDPKIAEHILCIMQESQHAQTVI